MILSVKYMTQLNGYEELSYSYLSMSFRSESYFLLLYLAFISLFFRTTRITYFEEVICDMKNITEGCSCIYALNLYL